MPPKSGLKGGAKRGAQKIDKKRQKLQDRRDGSNNKTKPGQGLMAQLKAPAPPKLEDLQQKMRARQSAKKELQRERVVAHQPRGGGVAWSTTTHWTWPLDGVGARTIN